MAPVQSIPKRFSRSRMARVFTNGIATHPDQDDEFWLGSTSLDIGLPATAPKRPSMWCLLGAGSTACAGFDDRTICIAIRRASRKAFDPDQFRQRSSRLIKDAGCRACMAHVEPQGRRALCIRPTRAQDMKIPPISRPPSTSSPCQCHAGELIAERGRFACLSAPHMRPESVRRRNLDASSSCSIACETIYPHARNDRFPG